MDADDDALEDEEDDGDILSQRGMMHHDDLSIFDGNNDHAGGKCDNYAHLFTFTNDKAGMHTVDKQRTNEIIYEMSKDSKCVLNEQCVINSSVKKLF